MVQAKQLQNSSVQVVDVDTVLHGPQPEFVGRADDLAASDTAAGQPGREPIRDYGLGRRVCRDSGRPQGECGQTHRPRSPVSGPATLGL